MNKVITILVIGVFFTIAACAAPSTPPNLISDSGTSSVVNPAQPQAQTPISDSYPKSHRLEVPHVYAGLQDKLKYNL